MQQQQQQEATPDAAHVADRTPPTPIHTHLECRRDGVDGAKGDEGMHGLLAELAQRGVGVVAAVHHQRDAGVQVDLERQQLAVARVLARHRGVHPHQLAARAGGIVGVRCSALVGEGTPAQRQLSASSPDVLRGGQRLHDEVARAAVVGAAALQVGKQRQAGRRRTLRVGRRSTRAAECKASPPAAAAY